LQYIQGRGAWGAHFGQLVARRILLLGGPHVVLLEHLLPDAVFADVLLGDAHGTASQFFGQKGTQGRPILQRKEARLELCDEAIRVSKRACF